MFIIILILIILLFNKYLSSILYKKKIGFKSLKIQEIETQFSLYYRIKRLSSVPKVTYLVSGRNGIWTCVVWSLTYMLSDLYWCIHPVIFLLRNKYTIPIFKKYWSIITKPISDPLKIYIILWILKHMLIPVITMREDMSKWSYTYWLTTIREFSFFNLLGCAAS